MALNCIILGLISKCFADPTKMRKSRLEAIMGIDPAEAKLENDFDINT